MDLEARSRWCLTGTPIQNRLQDIGALFAFLRAEPFHSIAQFRRFITVPFEQGNEIVKDRLVMLYDSLCLRRTKDILTLPGVKECVRRLEFSPKAREHYASMMNILNRSIRERVGQYDQVSKFGLFQAHLQLRILCNHGTYQRPFSWKRACLRDHANESLTVALGMDVEIRCSGCRQLKPLVGPSNTFSAGNCDHFLCSSCLEDLENIMGPQRSRRCPICSNGGGMDPHQSIGVQTSSFDYEDEADLAEAQDPQQDTSRDDYFYDEGFSVKMQALVQDVKEDLDNMKRLVVYWSSRVLPAMANERHYSIVFSCWTSTLDLVVRHLKAEDIDYIRIDGNTPMSKRQRCLDEFDKEAGARVLLMTTGTGAFG